MRKEESGRSLIEIIGVMAIGTIMIVAGYRIYDNVNQRQTRMIASDTLEDVAKKTKLLYELSGYPDGLNITKLDNDGALSSTKSPIGSDWSVAKINANSFKITVSGLSYDECEYFKLKKTDWATNIKANTNNKCSTGSNNNSIEFTVQ